MRATPWDSDTEFRIVTSDSPVSVDGFALGEPKLLECEHCSASALITRDPDDPGVDDLSHEKSCPQRFVRSDWFRRQMQR
jgi:hypothetical protein